MEEIKISHEEFKRQKAVMIDFIAHQLDVYNNNKLSPYGVTNSQAKMLMRLSDSADGRLSQSEFAAMGLRSSTVTTILSNLEKGGFVRRVTSETDARAKYIEITRKGREIQQLALKDIFQLEDLLTEGFSDEEKILFSMLLKRTVTNILNINKLNNENSKNN